MTSRNITVLTLGLCEFCHSFRFHCHAIKSKKWKPFNSESPQSGKQKKINVQEKLRQKLGLCDITYTRYSGKFLRKFTKLCMETPSWCPFEGHKYDGRKPKKASVFEFSYKILNTSLEEFIKIKVIFILRQGMFR